jgi:hypothetical protein
MELKKTTLRIERDDFTKEEMETMQKELATKTIELRHKENEKKAVNSQFTSSIDAIKASTCSLADNISAGFEHRNMECEIKFHWKKGTKDIIHPETKKVIDTQDITDEDRQMKLEVDGKNKTNESDRKD